MLLDLAHELEHLRASGLELDGPIVDDYGFARRPGAPRGGHADEDGD